MGLLERHILRGLARPFLMGVFVVTFLLSMDLLFDYLDLFLGKGIDLWTVLQLFFLGLGWMLALSVPCGVLVGVLMNYGRMAQDNEIVAIKASGISPGRVVRPALYASVVVAAGLVLFHNNVLPDMNHAFANLMLSVNQARPTVEIREGVTIDDFQGYKLFIGNLDDRTSRMNDVLIQDASRPHQPNRTIRAKRGHLVFDAARGVLNLHLEDGEIHEIGETGPAVYRRLDFAHQTLSIQGVAQAIEKGRRRSRGQREMKIGMMREKVAELTTEYDRYRSQSREALEEMSLESLDQLPGQTPDAPWHTRLARAVGLCEEPPPAPPDSFWTAEHRRLADRAMSASLRAASAGKKINQYGVEIHKKFSIPFAAIVFTLVGAPLGVRARRGGLTAGFLSVGFFVFYYLCLIGGEQLADRAYLPPWLSMWLPNIVLGAMGVWLMMHMAEVPLRRRRARPARG